jgi:hypothetical protein
MRRPVSSTTTSCWFFSSWYSREISLRAREVAFQSIWRRLSPTRYSRIWWKSVPSPRRRLTCAPISRDACSALTRANLVSGAKLGNTRTRCVAPARHSWRHSRSGECITMCTPSKAKLPRASGRNR